MNDLERRSGFLDWKEIPEPEYKLSVTEMALNVSPHWIHWGIVYHILKQELAIEWVRWAELK